MTIPQKATIDANGVNAKFPADNNNSASFKTKPAAITGNDGRKDVKTMVPLKYLSNFWRTLAILLINCEINLILTLSVIEPPIKNQIPTLSIALTKPLCSNCNFMNSR